MYMVKSGGVMSPRRKNISKKTKSSWRKFSDIKDVEDFLDEQRFSERIGQPELQRDDLLFDVDVEGKKVTTLLPRTKRRERAARPLKSLLALENTSKVEDPITKRNTRKLRNNNASKLKLLVRKAKRGEISVIRNSQKPVSDSYEDQTVLYDIWDVENNTRNTNCKERSRSSNRKFALKAQQREHFKSTPSRSAELPHPGLSYNPSLRDHADLMQTILEKEVKIMKREEHLKRVTTDMFSKSVVSENNFGNCIKKSGYKDEVNGNNCIEKDDEEATSNFSINPPVQNKKKNIRKLQNKRKHRQQMHEKKRLKLEKKKITDIQRLNAIMAEINTEEETLKDIKLRRKAARQTKPKRVAKVKFEEPDVYINSIQELSGNLRNLKTKFSILEDQFKCSQKQNIIPPSVNIGIQKRSKIKRFVRSSHKSM